ncbi:MAG: acyl carrier protein [Leptospirales bacterium]|nr:acyl carrier protein [Leptospirales bacterium]
MAESNEDILELVRKVLSENCRVEKKVQLSDRLAEDLRLDSVGMLTMALEIENHYRMNLGDEPDRPPRTVADVVQLISIRLKEKGN